MTRAAEHFREANSVAVSAILANQQRYGGEQSLMVQWARLWAAKAEAVATAVTRRAA